MKKLIVGLCLLIAPVFSAEYWPALTVNPTNGTVVSPTTNLTFTGTVNASAFLGNNPTTDAKYSSTTLGSEGIRQIGALGGYTLEGFLEDTALRGLARDLPSFVTSTTNLVVTWSDGDVYDPEIGYFHLASGSFTLVDNSVNHAYWQPDDPVLVKWTSGTRPSASTSIHLGTFTVAFGQILHESIGEPAGDKILQDDSAQADVMPSLIVSGLTVFPTGTDLTNIIINSGVEYHNLSERIDHPTFNMNTNNVLVMYTHTNSIWAKITTNLFPLGVWDNGSNIVACDPDKFYRGVFVGMASAGHLDWVLPTTEYTNLIEATAGADPTLPPGFDPYTPISTAYIFKGDELILSTDTSRWLDRRFMIRRGTLATGGGSGTTPTLQQVLIAGSGTGGILPSGMGYPSTDDQASSKGYVDSTRNKASTGTAYVDPINGDDITGRIQKASLPFKTIQAAIDACAVVATDSNRFLVACSIGTYIGNVTMKPYISVRGMDVESTLIVGTVTWPATYVDETGTELQILTVRATNEPAIVINAGSDTSYIGLRSCGVYSTYDTDATVKSAVKVSRGNAELYATTWVELVVADITAQRPSSIYYLTTDPANSGKYYFNGFSSSHVMRIADINDTILVAYCNATTDSFFASKSDSTLIYMDDSNLHSNRVTAVAHKQASSRTFIDSSIIDLRLSVTNECDIIGVSSTGSVATATAYLNNSRVIVPNVNEGHLFYASSATVNDHVEIVNTQIGNGITTYPVRYTEAGTLGSVNYFLQHGSGDLLLGGGIDISASTGSTPNSGHIKMFVNPYAGLEQPYFKDSNGNTIRICRDSIFNGYVEDGSTLPVGTPVYRKLGRSPQATPVVGQCFASNPATMPCVGIVTQVGGITNGGVGRVMFYGRTESYFNTSYATNGAPLYVGEGTVTNVAPANGGIRQQVGSVHTSSTNGWMSVQMGEADFLSPSMVAWTSSNTNTVNALTVGGYTKEQLTAQSITYYVWGSLAGPYTNPVSRLAQIASPVAEPVRTNSYLNCTNGMFLGGLSISTNESPRILAEGLVTMNVNLSSTSTNDCVIQGTLYIYESDQTTLVQSFEGELVHTLDGGVIHPYALAISVTNDVVIKDYNRIMLFRSRLVSGWNGERIDALSQDGYLTRITISGPISGVYASSTELNTEIADRTAGDLSLQSQITTETNRAIVADGVLTTNVNTKASTNQLNTVNTNLINVIAIENNRAIQAEAGLQTQINTTTNRVDGLEARSNVWNTASLPSTKFLANIGTANITYAQATAPVLFTNLVYNYGGTYSNTATVARWIPGVTGVMVRIMGAMSVNAVNQPVLFQMKLYKNGSLKSTMATRYSSSNNDDWAMAFHYIDITTSATDFYEVYVTSDKAVQTTLGSGNDNWWSGEVIR